VRGRQKRSGRRGRSWERAVEKNSPLPPPQHYTAFLRLYARDIKYGISVKINWPVFVWSETKKRARFYILG
jgi:hypothetical protein